MLYNEKFENTLIKNNVQRILVIGTIYTFFELIGLTLSTLGFFESDIRLFVGIIVLFHLIYLPVLFTMSRRHMATRPKKLYILQAVYFPVLLGWGCLFTGLMYLSSQDITIYSIVILITAGVFVIRPAYGRVLFTYALLFFGLLIYLWSDSITIANGLFFKSIIVTVLAYVLSSSNYKIREKLFIANDDLAKANSILREKVKRDSLTGLYNNGFIFEHLDQLIKKVTESGQPLSLAMIDIDDFKRINDLHGHYEGDLVIQAVANILINLSGEGITPARYGGEEFIIVLENRTKDEALELARHILTSIQNLNFTVDNDITVSIGVSQWNKDTRESFIIKTDEQLYQAKRQGKNRVCA